MMATVSPKARALIDAGRKGYRPTDLDRARVEAALDARLAVGAPPAARVHWTNAASTKLVLSFAFGAGLVATAFWLLRPSVPTPAHAREPASSALAASPTLAAPPDPVVPALAPELPAPSSKPPEPAPSARGQDSLSLEVALLSRATSALRAGHPEQALQALSEHQRRFPHGVLCEERRGAKAQALCALGRISEGRTQLGQLAAASPAAARARQVCDAGALNGR